MDGAIRTRIEQMNPWIGRPGLAARHAQRQRPSTYIERRAAASLAEASAHVRLAHLLIGPRQAGKSTLIWSMVARERRPLLFLNCEDPLARAWCNSAVEFGHELDEWLPEGGFLFLEEAQWLDEAGRFVKGLVDLRLNRRIVVTGSSSFHLMARTRESLAGRATYHRIWPLSLDEVAPRDPNMPLAGYRRDARSALERQLVFGGYPEAWTSHDPASVLGRLLTAFVLRDASDRFRLERPDAFRVLIQLMAGQIGDLVNYTEWAAILGISSSTVKDYIAVLEETHIVRRLRPFIGGKRAELTQTPKAYFIDNGLRNALVGGFQPLEGRTDVGKLVENWVFSELHARYPEPAGVRYWRTRNGAEVDFVLEPSPGERIAIEVKATRSNRHKIPPAARSFISAYKPRRFLVIHRGEPYVSQVGDCPIEWIPAELLPGRIDAIVGATGSGEVGRAGG